jgi:hypothetical protein
MTPILTTKRQQKKGEIQSVGSGSDSDNEKEVEGINEEEPDDNNTLVESLGWKLDTPFNGLDTTKVFEQVLKTRTNQRDGDIVTGIKVLKTSANSPAKHGDLL